MSFTEQPHLQALKLAELAMCTSNPNPRVGCVLTAADGMFLGQGYTQAVGGAHAEVMALRDAAANGHKLLGATAYVTLEPCAHQGRTSPCCDALITAGVKKVVASITDPNPLVAGQGFSRLRCAGVEVVVGLGAVESRQLNIGFFSRMVRKTPWVRMKVASSLDGKTALLNGQSQWITAGAARADGHAWRARSCAVLTGVGTLLADNPRLDVRLVATTRQPHLVVVDSQLNTPLNALIFNTNRRIFIYTSVMNTVKKAELEARGAVVVYSPSATHAKVDLAAMLRDLAQREVNEIHVEAGYRLNGSLIGEGLVDELLMYIAPKLLGAGRDLALFGPLQHLNQALNLDFVSTDMVGTDLRVRARVTGRDQF